MSLDDALARLIASADAACDAIDRLREERDTWRAAFAEAVHLLEHPLLPEEFGIRVRALVDLNNAAEPVPPPPGLRVVP